MPARRPDGLAQALLLPRRAWSAPHGFARAMGHGPPPEWGPQLAPVDVNAGRQPREVIVLRHAEMIAFGGTP